MNRDDAPSLPEDASNQISPRSGSGGRSEAKPPNFAAGTSSDEPLLGELLQTFPGSTVIFEDVGEVAGNVASRRQEGRRPSAPDARLDLKTYLNRPKKTVTVQRKTTRIGS